MAAAAPAATDSEADKALRVVVEEGKRGPHVYAPPQRVV